MKDLYYRIKLVDGTILPHKFERFDQAENFMIQNEDYFYRLMSAKSLIKNKNDIFGYIIIA